jgi:hypothetical protein
MDAIGIRVVFKPAKWPENLKAARAGKLMMWGVGWGSATAPDGSRSCSACTAPRPGQANMRASSCKAFDEV